MLSFNLFLLIFLQCLLNTYLYVCMRQNAVISTHSDPKLVINKNNYDNLI